MENWYTKTWLVSDIFLVSNPGTMLQMKLQLTVPAMAHNTQLFLVVESAIKIGESESAIKIGESHQYQILGVHFRYVSGYQNYSL